MKLMEYLNLLNKNESWVTLFCICFVNLGKARSTQGRLNSIIGSRAKQYTRDGYLYNPGADPGFQVRGGGGAHLKKLRRLHTAYKD